MKTTIGLTLLALLSSGCSVIDHSTLIGNLEQPNALDGHNIEICEGGYWEVGADCAELRGLPRWVHNPILLSYFGCAVNYHQGSLLTRTVIFSSSDWVTGHELEHAAGYDDGSAQFTTEPGEVRDVSALVETMMERYGDRCYRYNPVLLADEVQP